MLYYNITAVYQRQQSAWASGGMADTMNNDPGRIRSIEDHVRIWVRHDAAKVGPVRGAPAFRMGKKIDNGP